MMVALVLAACSHPRADAASSKSAERVATIPAWAVPPPEVQARIDRFERACPMFRDVLELVRLARFDAARERYEGLCNQTNCACGSDDLFAGGALFKGDSQWLWLASLLDEGEHGATTDDRFESYFKVAATDSSLRSEALRRIVPDGLNHWLGDMKKECAGFWGASDERCKRPLRLLQTVAPDSRQARDGAALFAETQRLDAMLRSHYLAASELLQARARVCEKLNDAECIWPYKNPEPLGKNRLARYEGRTVPASEDGTFPAYGERDGYHEDTTPGARQFLFAELCPSYWDGSPATLELERRWGKTLAEIPDGPRKVALRRDWFHSAHLCAGEGLGPLADFGLTKPR